MCLIVVLFRTRPDLPLVVAANRDEKLERPAVSAAVLRADGPRILGGRDLLAGGTWLAVNDHGVVAGLTNRPSAAGRDPTKRSRGELPLALAAHGSATEAVEHFVERFAPEDFNLAWLLVGDRASLYYVQMNEDRIDVEALGPGTHVLGNGPLHEPSPKTDHVRRRLAVLDGAGPAASLDAVLTTVVADHTIPDAPPGALPPLPAAGAPEHPEPPGSPDATEPTQRPRELAAACVHTEGYGTRSSALIEVGSAGLPRLWVADGPPCQSAFVSLDRLWTEDEPPTA